MRRVLMGHTVGKRGNPEDSLRTKGRLDDDDGASSAQRSASVPDGTPDRMPQLPPDTGRAAGGERGYHGRHGSGAGARRVLRALLGRLGPADEEVLRLDGREVFPYGRR